MGENGGSRFHRNEKESSSSGTCKQLRVTRLNRLAGRGEAQKAGAGWGGAVVSSHCLLGWTARALGWQSPLCLGRG